MTTTCDFEQRKITFLVCQGILLYSTEKTKSLRLKQCIIEFRIYVSGRCFLQLHYVLFLYLSHLIIFTVYNNEKTNPQKRANKSRQISIGAEAFFSVNSIRTANTTKKKRCWNFHLFKLAHQSYMSSRSHSNCSQVPTSLFT